MLKRSVQSKPLFLKNSLCKFKFTKQDNYHWDIQNYTLETDTALITKSLPVDMSILS